jgi:hypothetical protein
VKSKYKELPEELNVQKNPSKLEIEVEELWGVRNTSRFVGKSELKKRFHIGGRSKEEARKFWQSLPPIYQQCKA